MKNAYQKDIWRAICKGKKRFFSILLITALGVTMLTGLKAACIDLRNTADRFFDEQALFDLNIVSTLGLTVEDVAALQGLDGVAAAEGAYSETAYTLADGKRQSALVKTLSDSGINAPYLLEGTLPQKVGEIAVTKGYLQQSGKQLGDVLTLEQVAGGDTDTANLAGRTFTITAAVLDPTDINGTEGVIAFRSSSTNDHTFFICPEAVSSDLYTAIYLRVEGASDLLCYSDTYEETIEKIKEEIEAKVKKAREKARYTAITQAAEEELADGRAEMEKALTDAEKQLTDAEKELADGREQIETGWRELMEQEQTAKEGFSQARLDLSEKTVALEAGEAKIQAAAKALAKGEDALASEKAALKEAEDTAQEEFTATRLALEKGLSQVESSRTALEEVLAKAKTLLDSTWPEAEEQALQATALAAYRPVAELRLKIEALQTQLGALSPDAPAYAGLSQQLKVDTQKLEEAIQEASLLIAGPKDRFSAVLTPAVEAAIQAVENRLEALDPTSATYQQEKAALEAERNTLRTFPTALPQLLLEQGELEATQGVLTLNLNGLTEKEALANAQFKAAWRELGTQEEALAQGKAAIAEQEVTIRSARAQLTEGAALLTKQENEAKRGLAQGRAALIQNELALLDGERQCEDARKTLAEKRADAERELADAQAEIDAIDTAQWYIQDRSTLNGYGNIESDAASIEAVGTAFPIIFFTVAILISLTTITRMVEEDRGLIGTYKALGFSGREIRRKYLLYAASACLLGGLLGDLCGFILLPKIVFAIFGTMYALPNYLLGFDFLYGFGGILLFTGGIVGATLLACRAELAHEPAVLMRPKSPHAGSRVFLERFQALWSRLSFLNKVTARNLFRYKKRLLMTVFGIMGCTALVLCGFVIKDSVTELMPKQYQHIYQYDLMAVASPGAEEKLDAYLKEDGDVESAQKVRIDSLQVRNSEGQSETVQLIVLPKGGTLSGYIQLETPKGKAVELTDSGAYLTQNAAQVLGLHLGDTVTMRDLELVEGDASIAGLVQNYLGNTIYMTQELYESLFSPLETNGVLAKLSPSCSDQSAFADALAKRDGILSAVSTQALRRDFTKAFSLINMVVYIIIFMAAGLAFVVLFTLSTTNISERVRELATIKVLGFYDGEVHRYVNKETLILTGLGIFLGLPLGHILGSSLTYVLKMPSIHFAVSIYPISYLFAAVISFCFALLVDRMTNRTLDHIDPVEALKSVE